MWNAFIMTGNSNFNVNLSSCYDFDPNWNSANAYNYTKDKIDFEQPFIMPEEVIFIKDKKSVKNIRIHWKSSIISS
jgi:outer membrane receptor protein involved in Fe transport